MRGHFPGNPIIPGAVLLSAALQAIEAATQTPLSPYRMPSAKFFRSVLPGTTVVVGYSPPDKAGIRFSGSVDGVIVFTGHVQCHPEPTRA